MNFTCFHSQLRSCTKPAYTTHLAPGTFTKEEIVLEHNSLAGRKIFCLIIQENIIHHPLVFHEHAFWIDCIKFCNQFMRE